MSANSGRLLPYVQMARYISREFVWPQSVHRLGTVLSIYSENVVVFDGRHSGTGAMRRDDSTVRLKSVAPALAIALTLSSSIKSRVIT